MIQNVVVTKQGSEADNPARTIFSSSTPWELGGENLVVYLNGALAPRASYTVLGASRIQLSSSAAAGDQVSLLVTKFSSDEFDMVALDRVAKKLEYKAQTSADKSDFEESIPSGLIVHSDDVWATDIPPNPADAVTRGVAYLYNQVSLVEDLSVAAHKGWFATSNGALSGRIPSWVPPRFGQGYTVRLYDANSVEIPSSDPIRWRWDYAAGYLFIESDHSKATPFKVGGYQYIGEFGGVPGGGAANWKTPVPTLAALPTFGNINGDIRLVLDQNVLYRWDNIARQWVATTFSSARFKDPVLTQADLPPANNTVGDFRLALATNSIWRWDQTSGWVPVLNPHAHDDIYYEKPYVDGGLAGKAALNHDHHTLYYEKNEVDSMVRWRPPVADAAHLPPFTENRDGDMIVTLDTKTMWRFDYYGANQGHWVPVMTAQLYWLAPVATVSVLPMYGNTVGNVHLCLADSHSYFWAGSNWQQIEALAPHDHDDRYYTKEQTKWLYPAASKAALPQAGNSNGDVRLTLDDSSIHKWNGFTWVLISASPRWRGPVDLIAQLPTTGNTDRDIRLVRENKSVSQWNATAGLWEVVVSAIHNHDDLYYRKAEVDLRFSIATGHNHDGVNSRKVDYGNILNAPVISWKNPVVNLADLPVSGNGVGDARIVLNDAKIYMWDGLHWEIVSGQLPPPVDLSSYYTKPEVDDLLNTLELEFTNALALKADVDHIHDERYHRKAEVDAEFAARFNVHSGHDHDGTNSKRISWADLADVPPMNAHDHDERYYTRTQLQLSGESQVHWDNVTNKPDLANGHWRAPVQTRADLPMVGNTQYDIRMVLDESNIYEWDGLNWVFVGHWANQYVVYWREPVQAYADLPATANATGDVRLVLTENELYRWDGATQNWVIVSANASHIMIFLNGLLLMPNVDYVRIKDRSVKLLFAVDNGSRLTMIVTGETYMRRDWTTYYGQQHFEFTTSYYRKDWVNQAAVANFHVDIPFQMGGLQLIVWVNGDIQRIGQDYVETTTTDFRLLVDPLGSYDRVTAIVMNQPSGMGEYIQEDQVSADGQTLFSLHNRFSPGTEQLLVFWNGVLQKVDQDYVELNNTTIRTLNVACRGDEKWTFIIFQGGGIGNCPNTGADLTLGIPTDGDWVDGLLPFAPEWKINDAIDRINETLVDLAPTAPESLNNKALLLDGITLHAGYESDGNGSYEAAAGAYHTYLTEDGNFRLVTPDTTTFGYADQGVLNLWLNNSVVDSFNLGTAFVQANAGTTQTAVSYGHLAAGANGNEGVQGSAGAIRNSSNSLISILSVAKYNNFKRWQKGQARINVSSALLRQGYNTLMVEHVIPGMTQRTRTLKLFLDTSGTRPSVDGGVTCNEVAVNSSKYVSGVRYYSIGDQFRVVFSAVNIFNNTFAAVPAKLDMPGLQQYEVAYNNPAVRGPWSPPRIGDFFDFDGTVALNEYNEYSVNAVLTASTFDPFGPGQSEGSPGDNKLVNTYTNGSTDLIEWFRDELFRLPSGDYDTVPGQRHNVWNSQALLANGEALLFNNALQYANIDFRGKKPLQVANYSSFTGPQKFFRAFYKQAAKNAGPIIIKGLSLLDLTSNRILVDLKLPTQTGWMSLNKMYDVSVFRGADGDGCLLNNSGNVFTYSSGTFSTANSGFMVVVRVTIPNTSAPQITYMEMQW